MGVIYSPNLFPHYYVRTKGGILLGGVTLSHSSQRGREK